MCLLHEGNLRNSLQCCLTVPAVHAQCTAHDQPGTYNLHNRDDLQRHVSVLEECAGCNADHEPVLIILFSVELPIARTVPAFCVHNAMQITASAFTASALRDAYHNDHTLHAVQCTMQVQMSNLMMTILLTCTSCASTSALREQGLSLSGL